MGTSSSSKGPGKGVPMVPPWVPGPPGSTPIEPKPVEPKEEGDEGDDSDGPPDSITAPSGPTVNPVAPAARFKGARSNLGKFASSGSAESLRRGVGHYFKTGYGGGGTSVARFAGTARTAGSLFGAFSAGGGPEKTRERDALERECRSGSSPETIITVLVEVLRPIDGTQDAEAGRKSLAEALSAFLNTSPNADLLNLTDVQSMSIVAHYVALDVYARFFLDIGKAILDNAPSYSLGLSRMREAKEYIRETIVSAFSKMLAMRNVLTSNRVLTLVSSALRDAIDVFQGYTQ